MKRKKIISTKKIINFLLNILIFIFGIILLISIYTGVQTKILGNDYANFFGYSIFEVQTGSMTGTINAGDWIIVNLTRNVKLNDIITYKLGGDYITHRIIEVYNGSYITKGDANTGKDDPIEQNQVVGKVVNIWPSLGVFRKTIFNPSVLIALIITLIIFNLAIKRKAPQNRKDDELKRSKQANDGLLIDIDYIVEKISVFMENIKKKQKAKRFKQEFFSNNDNIKDTYQLANDKQDLSKETNIVNNKKGTESNEHYKDEDELEKTSLYRVIPVDYNEVDDKYIEEVPKVETEDHYQDEDDLDKTSLYRVIPVDTSEINDTFLEIAQNEIKEAEQKEKKKEKTVDLEMESDEEPEDEALTNVNLDLLKKQRANRSKNIIDAVMNIKREELHDIINLLLKDDNSNIDKVTIRNDFIDAYIDSRYFNYDDDKNTKHSHKNFILKIEKHIKKTASELINNYKGKNSKHKDIVDKYVVIFILIANLEQAKDLISEVKPKKEFYKKAIEEYGNDWDNKKIELIITEINKIQKSYSDTVAYFLKTLETNMFELRFNPFKNKKDMYGLELEHNITFSKVYSDYIIDKTYSEGVIAEDKIYVLLTLLSIQLIEDMMLPNFNKKYILYVPETLYSKERKLEKLLRMFDNKYAKDNIIILITIEDLLANKQVVKEVRRRGYKFAIVFDKEITINKRDRGNIYIADYLFINKKDVNFDKIFSSIPEDLLEKIIDEELINKVEDYGRK